MIYTKKIVYSIVLVVIILLTVLFNLGDESVREVVKYLPPPQSQLAQVSAPTSGMISHQALDGGTEFDGIDDRISLDSIASNVNLAQGTMSVWFKGDLANTTLMGILEFGRPSSNNDGIRIRKTNSSGRVELVYRAGAVATEIFANGVSSDTWNHAVLVWRSDLSIEAYINGVSIGTGVRGENIASPLNQGSIGSDAQVVIDRFFKGSIRDVRIYDHNLSASEISNLYQAGKEVSVGGNEQTPVDTGGGAQTPTDPLPPSDQNPVPSGSNRNLTVKKDGTGNFTTIQACADEARPGDTCTVYAGTYERVEVTKSGTAGNPITFRALSGVISNGFLLTDTNTYKNYIKASYITIEGFTFTGSVSTLGNYMVEAYGDYINVDNNTFTGTTGLLHSRGMITLDGSFSRARNNKIIDWVNGTSEATAIQIKGINNLVEGNLIRNASDIDVFQAFGHDHIFRNNTIINIYDTPQVGTHIDLLQIFGNSGSIAYNILFEKNFINGLQGQIGQLVQSCGPPNENSNVCTQMPGANGTVGSVSANTITDNMQSWPSGRWPLSDSRGYIAILVSGRALGHSYVITSHTSNRLTLMDPDGSSADLIGDGVASGDLFEIRNRTGWWMFRNNVFANILLGLSGSITDMTFVNNTYFNTLHTFSGGSAERGRSMNGKVVNSIYLTSNNPNLYGFADDHSKATFFGDYNYAATVPGYTPRNEDRCTEEYAFFRFCEAVWPGKHGINGGDPGFQNSNDLDGPDNVAFTSDDGLKPYPNSRLCGKGYGGADIGAYSCAGNTVFSNPPGAISVSQVASPPQPAGSLVLHLNFENDWGLNNTVVDASGNNTNATCQKSFYVDNDMSKQRIDADQCPEKTPGPHGGQAASFSGSVCNLAGDYLAVNSSQRLNNLSKGTVSVWINYSPRSHPSFLTPYTSTRSERVLDTESYMKPNTWYLGRKDLAQTFFASYNDAGTAMTTLVSFPDLGMDSTWNLYTVTWDGSMIRAYFNGQPFAGSEKSQLGFSSFKIHTYMAIGALMHGTLRNAYTNNCRNYYPEAVAYHKYSDTQQFVMPNAAFLNGKLDDVRIYDYSLTAAEVRGLYSVPSPINTPVIIGDFNSDNKVNSLDFSALSSKWNQSSPTHDLNKDGTVNSLDFSLMAQNWTG